MTDLTAALYDIVEVLEELHVPYVVMGQLDQTYLRHWADELGVRPQLEKALGEFSR